MKANETNKKSNKIIVFTDGASRGNPGPGGWGAVVIDNGKVSEIGGSEKNTTNNRMELTAAIEVIAHLQPTTNNQQQIQIYTDSSYLINGITKWVYSWEKRNWITVNKEPVLNKDLWEKLLELVKLKKIEWKHVKGHAGTPGNERADEIATAFADGKEPNLYLGVRPLSNLEVGLLSSVPLQSNAGGRRRKPYSYVSMLDGVIKKHNSWAECEGRVKGKSGAKFKKTLSVEEEKEIMKSWQKS